MERAGPDRGRGYIPFFLDQGGVMYYRNFVPSRRKYVLDKPLKGMIFLPFYPKLVGVEEMVLFIKVDLRMNCFFKLSLNN